MSPTVFREKGYRFFFFSREEPRMHVHVIKNHGYNRQQLKEIESLIEGHKNDIVSAWQQHFSS